MRIFSNLFAKTTKEKPFLRNVSLMLKIDLLHKNLFYL